MGNLLPEIRIDSCRGMVSVQLCHGNKLNDCPTIEYFFTPFCKFCIYKYGTKKIRLIAWGVLVVKNYCKKKAQHFFIFKKLTVTYFLIQWMMASVKTILSQRFLWRPAVYWGVLLRKLFTAPFIVGQETLSFSRELFYRHLSKPMWRQISRS